jgi:uncharacterized SAM-binding protein YcdF (DUF218 family)
MKLKLFRQRTLWVPTAQGCALIMIAVLLCGWICFSQLYGFLAMTAPVPSKILVVEGWASDDVLKQSIQEFYQNKYQCIVTVGVPVDHGSYLLEFKTFAEIAAQSIKKMGVPENMVFAAPGHQVNTDRTYQSALAFKQWLQKNRPETRSINLFSGGTHARRTRLLFQKALGPEIKVGIMSKDSEDYNGKNWYRRSAGVREVLSEFIAYGYARFIFRPPANARF